MSYVLKNLKTSIKQLSDEKVRTREERRAYKEKASQEFRQSSEYHEWFQASDEEREDLRGGLRHRLLAYAFLRGRKYRDVEQNCGEFNKPSACLIENILDKYGDNTHAALDNVLLDTSKRNIKPWLKGEVDVGYPWASEVAA